MTKCHLCIGCDNVFKSEKAKDDHGNDCFGRKTKKYPPRDKDKGEVKKMKFKNIERMSKCPFVAYADCKDFLRPLYKRKGPTTKLIQEHNANCCGFYFVDGDGRKEYFDFFPPNPTEKFVEKLVHLTQELFDEFWEGVLNTNLTFLEKSYVPKEEILRNKRIRFSHRYFLKNRRMPNDKYCIGQREKARATSCFLCGQNFNESDKTVIDHNHFTGKYFGIAHNSCNLKRRMKPETVVIFANFIMQIMILLKFFQSY